MAAGSVDSRSDRADASRYWDHVASEWRRSPQAVWRAHSDTVNRALFARWLPGHGSARALKTDLFDEAVGTGLHELLAHHARRVVGIDVSAGMARAARADHPSLTAIGGDVRALPFADDVFDVVVSDSTLDHLDSQAEILASLRELHRVLRRRGQLLLTLDNMSNPVIALRSRMPFGLLHRLGLVPYRFGTTCGPRRLTHLVAMAGFEVIDTAAVLHCPRVLAVAVARAVDAHGGPATRRRVLAALGAFEALARWPTRFLTGHYIAVRGVKR